MKKNDFKALQADSDKLTRELDFHKEMKTEMHELEIKKQQHWVKKRYRRHVIATSVLSVLSLVYFLAIYKFRGYFFEFLLLTWILIVGFAYNWFINRE